MPPSVLASNPEFRQLAEHLAQKITELSKKIGLSEHALTNALSDYILGEENRKWGRERLWRVRIELYRDHPGTEPFFDSDPHSPCDAPGDVVQLGFQAVEDYVVEIITKRHKVPCAGLDSTTLKRKLSSLRSMMANRRDGSGNFKIQYETSDKWGTQRYIARVMVHSLDLYPPPQELFREPNRLPIGKGGMLNPANGFQRRFQERLKLRDKEMES